MKNGSIRTIIIVSCRLILGFAFIYASIPKIIDPDTFSKVIDLYKITPIQINNLVALVIPWVELLIGIGLILNRYIKGSIVLSVLLFIIFITMLSQAYLRWFTLDCGCFGSADKLSDIQLRVKMIRQIILDIIFLSMSVYLYFIYV